MACIDSYSTSDLDAGFRYGLQGFGVFYHWGPETYEGQVGFQATPATAQPATAWPSSTVAPTGTLDFHQWLLPAKMAGAKYAIFTCKHHWGWCAWPTATTTYDVATANASISSRDLVDEFKTACDDLDMNAVFYFSIADRHYNPDGTADGGGGTTAEYYHMDSANALTYMKNQLTELMAYGPYAIWLDVHSYASTANKLALYQHIKGIDPDCVILMNYNSTWLSDDGCSSTGAPGGNDIVDGWADVFAVEVETVPSGYTLPFETVRRIKQSGPWFTYDNNDIPDQTTASILSELETNLAKNAAYCLNLAPGPDGSVNEAQCAAMRDLALARGVFKDKIGVTSYE